MSDLDDFDSGIGDPEFPHDWRGRDIGVASTVLWREGTTSRGRWAIGLVTEVQREVSTYHYWENDVRKQRVRVSYLLDIDWTEQSNDYGNTSGKARGVLPANVTVFPRDA